MKRFLTRELDFASLATLICTVFTGLAMTLLIWPAVIHWLFQIASDPATDIMSRRAAMLFAGMSWMIWQMRHAPDSPLRQAICHGLTISLGGLAALGLIEWLRGAVGLGIVLAIATELFFVAHLLRFLRGAPQ